MCECRPGRVLMRNDIQIDLPLALFRLAQTAANTESEELISSMNALVCWRIQLVLRWLDQSKFRMNWN